MCTSGSLQTYNLKLTIVLACAIQTRGAVPFRHHVQCFHFACLDAKVQGLNLISYIPMTYIHSQKSCEGLFSPMLAFPNRRRIMTSSQANSGLIRCQVPHRRVRGT